MLYEVITVYHAWARAAGENAVAGRGQQQYSLAFTRRRQRLGPAFILRAACSELPQSLSKAGAG